MAASTKVRNKLVMLPKDDLHRCGTRDGQTYDWQSLPRMNRGIEACLRHERGLSLLFTDWLSVHRIEESRIRCGDPVKRM